MQTFEKIKKKKTTHSTIRQSRFNLSFNACDRAARSNANYDHVDFAVERIIYFFSRALIMRNWISAIQILENKRLLDNERALCSSPT